MDKLDLLVRTGKISTMNISSYALSGYIPIFICRFMNPLVKVYEGTELHFPELSPSPGLLFSSKSNEISWDRYKELYLEEVSEDKIKKSLLKMNELVNLNPSVNAKGVVLLCYCKDYTRCHRSILAERINNMSILRDEVMELYV